ncbi:hypothetical protein ASALC70_03113 [Alcanivorax sp. ALC70]|nr:hypothetical protein ASALC70_03113 [Alcanivorax sp. ALC70]
MQYLQGALLLGGLLLVALAYGRYIRRTGDWSGVLRFWAGAWPCPRWSSRFSAPA